jgi:hypothetical protein
MLTLSDRPRTFTPVWYPVGVPAEPITPAWDPAAFTLRLLRDGLVPETLTGVEALLWGTAWEQGGIRTLAGDLPPADAAALLHLRAAGWMAAWPDLWQPLDLWAFGLAAIRRPPTPPDLPRGAATLLDALDEDPWLARHLPPSGSLHAFRAALSPLLGRAVVLMRPPLPVGEARL